MTREEAAHAARILEQIYEFEDFRELVLDRAAEITMGAVTRAHLTTILDAEMQRLNDELAKL